MTKDNSDIEMNWSPSFPARFTSWCTHERNRATESHFEDHVLLPERCRAPAKPGRENGPVFRTFHAQLIRRLSEARRDRHPIHWRLVG